MAREYKDSGIEWIGRIPKDWKTEKFKHIFRIKKIIAGKLGYDVLSVTQQGLKVKNINEGQVANDYSNYQIVHVGDFVMNHMDLLTGYVDVSKQEGVTSPDYRSFYAIHKHEIDCRYYLYIFQFCYMTRLFYNLGQGVSNLGRWRLPAEQQNEFVLPFPPLIEQQRIASYLDKKCAEIDSLVELQEQMIAQLTDYKQSVITEAVTKGLNPEAELVSSGIDWIGDYPKHWEIIKIGFIFDNLDYLREPISAELRERNNPQYDYYGASGVIDKIDHYNVDDKVLLIGEDGANLVMRNLPLIYKAEGKFWVNNHAHILKPKKDDYDYLAHALEAANYRNYITGSAQPKLSQENLQAVKLPIPPLAEQQAIASYLDTKCHEIDSLISLKRQKIEMLKDYKKSIIFEAVTGKTDLESLALIGRNHWH